MIKTLLDICNNEIKYNIYNYRISDIPIWRIVYRQFRDRQLHRECGTVPLNSHRNINLISLLRSSLISIHQIFTIFRSDKQYSNLIFGFPRIETINNISVDKLTDPLILLSDIKKSFLYFESGRSGIHSQNRLINTNVIWTEGIDLVSKIFGTILSPIQYILHYNKFKELFKVAGKIYSLRNQDKLNILLSTSRNLITCRVYRTIIKKTSAQNVFATALMNRPALLSACIKSKINCYEIQHGITEGPTAMYSGAYLPFFSPKKFLAFGSTSINPFFNVPESKIINIGYAFKTWIKEHRSESQTNDYLFISNPQITTELIQFIIILKKTRPEIKYAIRFHPMETISDNQKLLLKQNQIIVTNNKENSNLAVLKYKGVIGGQSSVLYESISMGIKTAKIFYGTINKQSDIEDERKKGYFILTSPEDFELFIESSTTLPSSEFYSDFKSNIVNDLIKQN